MSESLVELRCHSCSHKVGTAAVVMVIAGLFKASLLAKVARSHPDEVRRRCRSCGFVNIFHPAPAPRRGRMLELK